MMPLFERCALQSRYAGETWHRAWASGAFGIPTFAGYRTLLNRALSSGALMAYIIRRSPVISYL